MPRIRTIKPELPSDKKLAAVSRDARLTFILIITQSDDEGLLAAAPRQLLGQLYPHDDDVTAEMLAGWVGELVTAGILRWRATTDGAPVLEITNWSRHQRVDNKGRSLLAATLVPLAEVRGESPRDAEGRGWDLGPRTMDLGEGPGKGTEDQPPPPPAREGHSDEFADERHRDAYLGFRRAAQNPRSLDHELKLLAEGGERPGAGLQRAFGWEVVGEALAQLGVNGGRATSRALQRFCETVVAGERAGPSDGGGSTPSGSPGGRAAHLWHLYATSGLTREGVPRQEVERIGRQLVADGEYPTFEAFLAEYIAVEPGRLGEARSDRWAIEQIAERLARPRLMRGADVRAAS